MRQAGRVAASYGPAVPGYTPDERARAIGTASLGPDQPDASADLHNLAMLLRDTNRLDEAEPLLRRALAISEASLVRTQPPTSGPKPNR